MWNSPGVSKTIYQEEQAYQKHSVYDPNQPAVYSQQQIEKTLPHRYPFLLVDKIIELTDTIL